MYSLIDPPGMFDTLEAWERYLGRMEALPKDALEREPSIRKAKRVIEDKRNRASVNDT